MIPIRDDVPSRTTPIVTISILVVNALAFLYQLMLGPGLRAFFADFAVIPALYFSEGVRGPGGWIQPLAAPDLVVPLFTSMFLHGGWLHLIGNMVYLWIFGDNVEDRLGRGRFVVFYLLCGLTASGAHIFSNPGSVVPSLGASGAIAGVLGAYVLLYPKARVVVLMPFGFFLHTFQVPAVFFLGFWFVQQLLYGTLSLGVASAQTGGVAWWAHIGGFAAGFLLVKLFARRRPRPAARDVWWTEAR